jgi:hypothetical protein
MWWRTRDWRASDGVSSTLQKAREMLAPSIVALNGAGFPQPDAASVPANPSSDEVWRSCAGAVKNASGAQSLGNHVLFWTFSPNDALKPDDQPGLGLNWPFLPESHVNRCSDTILEKPGGVPKRLFFYQDIDPNADASDIDVSAGFWPKPGSVAAQGAQGTQGAHNGQGAGTGASAPPPDATIPEPRRMWGSLLFGASMLMAIYVVLWVWHIAQSIQQKVPFFEFLTKLLPDFVETDDQTYSLVWPWLTAMTAFMLLIAAAGLYWKGQWFGALIDSQNRFSLSRTQQLAWSVLLLNSLAVVAWFNAAWIFQEGDSSATDLFPVMSGSLWAALGINLALSPLIRNSVLTVKSDKGKEQAQQSGDTPAKPQEIVTPALLDKNGSPAEASWMDLMLGENEGTQNQIDISRLQHLVISGLLLSSYFLQMLGAISVLSVSPAHADPIFTKMPVPGETFIALLAFSHAGYLIFKARSGEGINTSNTSNTSDTGKTDGQKPKTP